MSITTLTTFALGSFTAITAYKNNLQNARNQGQIFYKQEHLDYKMLGAYFAIITPYQLITIPSRFSVVTKIHYQSMNPYIRIPLLLSFISLINGSNFGLGYILGSAAHTALYR
jgi:hypothetical protein